MSARFYATSRIKHGIDHRKADDPTYLLHETKWFEVGDHVTGLPVEDMKALWAAGVLERREDGADKSEAKSVASGESQTPASGEQSSEGAGSPAAS